MTLTSDVKFKGKLTCGLKNDMRNFINFHASCQKSRKFYFDGHLLSKVYRVVQLKSVVELCVMILKNEQNLEEKWIVVSKLTWRIWWALFNLRTKKPWKFALWLIDSFCLKNIMFQPKNYRGVMCADNEVWCEI